MLMLLDARFCVLLCVSARFFAREKIWDETFTERSGTNKADLSRARVTQGLLEELMRAWKISGNSKKLIG